MPTIRFPCERNSHTACREELGSPHIDDWAFFSIPLSREGKCGGRNRYASLADEWCDEVAQAYSLGLQPKVTDANGCRALKERRNRDRRQSRTRRDEGRFPRAYSAGGRGDAAFALGLKPKAVSLHPVGVRA